MPTYVYRDGQMVNKATGLPDPEKPFVPVAPMVIGDIEPYQSPIDGSYVGGRRSKRYDLEKNNCIDAGDMPSLGGKFRNEKFCAKRGLKVSQE